MNSKIFHLILLFVFPFILSAQSTAKEWYNKGVQLKEKQDYEAALKAFKNAISKKADYAEAYYQAGWCSIELEKFQDGVDFLKKYSPTANENKKDKFNDLGFAYYKLQKSKEAIEEYNNTLTIFANNGVALRGIGNVYYEIEEDHEKAIQYFEKALEVDKEESRPVYYKLGWLYNDKEQYDDAINILLKAIEYDSEDSGYREELGYAYFKKEQYEFAITQLNKAISLDESSKLGYYYKGLCFIATNKKGDAMSMYYKLKDIGSDEADELLQKINGMK
jgi:tetratricopeptide (TPR) repeat protein